MQSVETIVIGAGLAGASVASRLPGAVRVLEQGAQPAAEASAQNAGMVRLLVDDPVERNLSLRAGQLLAELDERWSEPPSRVTGAVHGLVHDPTALDDGVAHLRAAGIAVEAVDRPETVAPALAGARLSRAWWVPEARVADPHALVHGLLRDRTVQTGVRVRSVATHGGRVVGVDTDQGRLAADRVVVAAGAWSGALARDLGLHRPLHPIRRSLLWTTPHPLARPEHPWCWLEDMGLYIRPEAGGWLVSGCDERIDPPGPGPGSAGEVDAAWRDVVGERLLECLPAVADLGWRGGWTGLRTFAPDRRPILGPDPELPGLVWVAGLGGFGLTSHLAIGEAVATWMEGGELPWLRRGDVDPARPYPRRWVITPRGTHHGRRLVDG